MDISNLITGTKTLSKEFNGEEVSVTYNPTLITPDRLTSLRKVEDLGDNAPADAESSAVVALLADILVDWNLTSDGEPIPTTEDAIRKLAIGVSGLVFSWIQEDQAPAKEGGPGNREARRSASRSGSRTKA